MASTSTVETAETTRMENSSRDLYSNISNNGTKRKGTKLEALTPKDDLYTEDDSNFQVYKEFLDDAFNNPKIHNLALSGSLGSGKSSIIRSYDRARNKGRKHFLYVSLIEFSNTEDTTIKEISVKDIPKEATGGPISAAKVSDGTAPNEEIPKEATLNEEEIPRNENPKRNASGEDHQKQLEYSLLSQILSCCTSKELPESSLSGIPERFRWLRVSATLLATLCFAIYMIVFHRFFREIVVKLSSIKIDSLDFSNFFTDKVSECVHLGLYAFVGVVLGLCVYRILRRYLPMFRFSKLTLKANNAEAEVVLGKDCTSLDIHKFELAYILERIGKKYDYTVVLEDLERLNPDVALDIMEKLRELNVLTNNHIQAARPKPFCKFIRRLTYKRRKISSFFDKRIARHRIRFVYAISESAIDSMQRTKFYDCIIPVIPVSNPLNGNEQLAKLMEELDIPQESRTVLSNALSDAFLDYRTRMTLKNEFLVLWKLCMPPKTVEDIQDPVKTNVVCNKATMFAIAAYKVLLPRVFEDELSPDGTGILPNLTSSENNILFREYPQAEQRSRIFHAIESLYRDTLLEASCLRLIIGDHQLFDHWLKILLGTLDKYHSDDTDLDRARTVITAIQQTNRDPALRWHLSCASYHGSFRTKMYSRLHDLCSDGKEAQFICIADSLAATSDPNNQQDWEWINYLPENKKDQKVCFCRWVKFLAKHYNTYKGYNDYISCMDKSLSAWFAKLVKSQNGLDMWDCITEWDETMYKIVNHLIEISHSQICLCMKNVSINSRRLTDIYRMRD